MLVGLLAGVLTTGCWVPQLVRSLRTRKVDSFSWLYLVAIGSGIGLWFVYGVLRHDLAIELPNALSFSAVALLTVLKLSVTVHPDAGPADTPEADGGAGPDSISTASPAAKLGTR